MKLSSAFLALALFATPLVASADQISDLQAQVKVLTQVLAQLQQQRAQGGGSSSACSAIVAPLKLGASGIGVSQLQEFLARDPSVYPEGKVTGYYGALTQSAVQRFQAKNDIVSSGTPSSTGYGKVGPQTARAILAQCGGGGSAVNTGPVGGFIQVSPVSGPPPLQVNVQATVNSTDSCAPAFYTIDFGDGTQVQPINVPAGTCKSLQQTYTHTYSIPGMYSITLAAGEHSSQATVVVQ